MSALSIEDQLAAMIASATQADSLEKLRSIIVDFIELYVEDRYAGDSSDDEYDPYEHDDE